MSLWIQQSANSRQFYIKFSREFMFQQERARASTLVTTPNAADLPYKITCIYGSSEISIISLTSSQFPGQRVLSAIPGDGMNTLIWQ